MARLGRSQPGGRNIGHSFLRGPTVLAPVETKLRVTLARAIRTRTTYFGIIPTVVDPAAGVPPVETELRTYLARRVLPLRYPRSRLTPPTVVDPPAQPPPDAKIRVYLAQAPPIGYQRWRKAGYSLSGPLVVNLPLPVEPTFKATLAPSRDPARRFAKSFLRRIAILTPPAEPPVETTLKATLAPSRDPARRFAKSFLRPPPVLAPLPVEATFKATLAPSRDPARRFAKSMLRPPTVIEAAPHTLELTEETSTGLILTDETSTGLTLTDEGLDTLTLTPA